MQKQKLSVKSLFYVPFGVLIVLTRTDNASAQDRAASVPACSNAIECYGEAKALLNSALELVQPLQNDVAQLRRDLASERARTDTLNQQVATLTAALENLHARVIPSSAILAIDGKVCPDGWSPVDDLAGRFPVGARDREGSGLSVRVAGTLGGAEIVMLTQDQLAPHQHDFKDNYYVEIKGDRKGRYHGSGSSDDDNLLYARPNITAHGPVFDQKNKQRPVSIVPPYYVVIFCRSGK